MIIRATSFVVGVGLVAAAAYGAIVAAGGFGTTASYYAVALSAGIIIGAIVIGQSLRQRRHGLAAMLALGMLAGEAFNFLATADRVILAAESTQAPLQAAMQRHTAALRALADAEAEKPLPASSERLEKAEQAKATADQAAREQASLPGCRQNCAALLQTAVDSAARDVNAARAALADHDRLEEQRLRERISAAKAALDQAPLPASATPFADRIGVSPAALDLLKAALLAIAVNGLAAALIAFAAHATPETESVRAEIVRDALPTQPMRSSNNKLEKLAPPKHVLSVIDFGAERLMPSPGNRLDFDEFFGAYTAQAKLNDLRASNASEIAAPFKQLCEEAGIGISKRGPKLFLCDVKLVN